MADFVEHLPDPGKKIDWSSPNSVLCVSPLDLKKIPPLAIAEMRKASGLLWVKTSGTTRADEQRWIGLSKSSFLLAAENVCRSFFIGPKDTLLTSLPRNHVGGLAIEARAKVSGANLLFGHTEKWNPTTFLMQLEKDKVSVVSLVPTQIFDLVSTKLKPPAHLRIVFVGGGALSGPLALEAKELGWPLEVTYGSTEMSSMIARAEWREDLDRWIYQAIQGNRIEVQSDSTARIYGPGLFVKDLRLTTYGAKQIPTLCMSDPPMDELGISYWQGEDRFESADDGQGFIFLGRSGDSVKISGELVSLIFLREILERILLQLRASGKAVLLANKHLRSENEIVLVAEYSLFPIQNEILDRLTQEIRKFERPQRIYWVDKIPETAIGKIWYGKIFRDLQLL